METFSKNHATYSLGYHIIFCPKFRYQVLKGAIEVELRRILVEVCKVYEWRVSSLEIMPDHVHIFVQAHPSTSPMEIAKTLKSISAVRLFSRFPELKKRRFWGTGLWSRGTYYASVGNLSAYAVQHYIDTQKERS